MVLGMKIKNLLENFEKGDVNVILENGQRRRWLFTSGRGFFWCWKTRQNC